MSTRPRVVRWYCDHCDEEYGGSSLHAGICRKHDSFMRPVEWAVESSRTREDPMPAFYAQWARHR